MVKLLIPLRQPVLLPEPPGDVPEPGVGQADGLFPVRIDEAAGRGGEQALGQELLPVDAGPSQEGPQVFHKGHQTFSGFAAEHVTAGGHQAPGQDPAFVQELADAGNVSLEHLPVGVDIHGQDIQVPVEEEFPIRVAAEVDTPGPLNLRKKAVQVLFGPDIRVAGNGTEDELHARLVDEHEGPGVPLFQLQQLGLDPAGHEVDQEGPHFVIKDDRPVGFIQDFQAEADRPFELPPDGGIAAQVHFQEAVVNRGIGGRDVEIIQVVPMFQQLGQFLIELVGIEADGLGFRKQEDAGEVFRGLDVHVFVIVQVGQLRPKGDVQGQGQFQRGLHPVVGQNGHGCGQQVAGNQGHRYNIRVRKIMAIAKSNKGGKQSFWKG